MTQNTQTTAERIRNLIFDAIQDSPYGDESIVAAPLGVTIAAEIDAKDRRISELEAEVAKLKKQNRILATTSLRDVIKSVYPSGRARGQ